MKKKIPYILLSVLLLLQIISLHKIDSLKNELVNTRELVNQSGSTLQNRINDIYSGVDQALKKKESIIAGCSYVIGDINMNSLKVPVTFTVQPKTLSDSTEISLKFADKILPMEKSGTEFVLTEEFDFDESILPTVIIENDGVQQFEQHPYLEVYGLISGIFPELYPHFVGESSCSGIHPYSYHMKGFISVDCSYADEANPFTEANFIVSVDGEEIEKHKMNASTLELDAKYNLEDEQRLEGKLVAKDSRGFSYEATVFYYEAGSNKTPDLPYGNQKVFAPDGRLVYESPAY